MTDLRDVIADALLDHEASLWPYATDGARRRDRPAQLTRADAVLAALNLDPTSGGDLLHKYRDQLSEVMADRDRLRAGIADVRRTIVEHRYSAARVTTVTDALDALLDDQEDDR